MDSKNTRIAQVRQLFDTVDCNKDGRISVSDLCILLNEMKIYFDADELYKMLNVPSHDKTYEITFDTVLATVERLEADQEDYMREREAELLTLFKAFDKDQDGQIVAEELQHVLTEATKRYYSTDEASLILQKADKDNNGLINFDELVDFLRHRGT